MPKSNAPRMRRQRRSQGDIAYVVLSGQRVYCGRWGTSEAKERYRRELAEWLARGMTPPVAQNDITIGELADAYTNYIYTEYADSRSVKDRVRLALLPLCELYSRVAAADFGPVALKCVRDKMVDSGLSLTSVNARITTIKAMLRHCVECEMVAGEVYHRCAAVAPLKRGRSRCKQPRVVKPVPAKDIDAVLAHLPRSVAAAVQLQRLTGARSGEILGLRPCDFDTGGDVWVVQIQRHKTAIHGKGRILCFGPKAQAMLRPFMLRRRPDEYLFSPRDHFQERKDDAVARGGGRRLNQSDTPRKTDQTVGDKYDSATYARCIRRACIDHGVTPWSPHQLRHLAATELRAAYGVEVARVVLGHTSLATTQIYAEADQSVVMKAMSEVG